MNYLGFDNCPLMGLIVQPIIGHYSDKTLKFGRRKPFFSRCFVSLNWTNINASSRNFIAFLPALWVGAGMLMIMDASLISPWNLSEL
jgi:maltose/moltooligosaccharide transporter